MAKEISHERIIHTTRHSDLKEHKRDIQIVTDLDLLVEADKASLEAIKKLADKHVKSDDSELDRYRIYDKENDFVVEGPDA